MEEIVESTTNLNTNESSSLLEENIQTQSQTSAEIHVEEVSINATNNQPESKLSLSDQQLFVGIMNDPPNLPVYIGDVGDNDNIQHIVSDLSSRFDNIISDVSNKTKSFYRIIEDAYEKLCKDPESIPYIKVNPLFMQVFSIVLKNSPHIFNHFEISLNKILKDGKININDIPEIINLLKLVYTSIHNLNLKNVKKELYTKIAVDIVYTVFAICIEFNVIKVNIPNETLKQFLSILVSCNDLIEISIQSKNRWICC